MTRPRGYLRSRRHRGLRMMPAGCLSRCRTTLPPARTCRAPAGPTEKSGGTGTRRSVRSGACPIIMAVAQGAASKPKRADRGHAPMRRSATPVGGCASSLERPSGARLAGQTVRACMSIPAPGTPARKTPPALRQRRSVIIGGQMRPEAERARRPPRHRAGGARAVQAHRPLRCPTPRAGRAWSMLRPPAPPIGARMPRSFRKRARGILALRTAPDTCNPQPL